MNCRDDTRALQFLATVILPLAYVNQQKVLLAGGDYQLPSTINIRGNMVAAGCRGNVTVILRYGEGNPWDFFSLPQYNH